MPHAGGQNSKLSRDLANVRIQLKSGRSRGVAPRDLDPDEIGALEKKRDNLVADMQHKAKERGVARIISHTTAAVNSAADRIIESQVPSNQRLEAIAAIFVDGKAPPKAKGQSAQERLAQIRQIKSSLTTEADELREDRKNERVQAAEDREKRMNTVKTSRKERRTQKPAAPPTQGSTAASVAETDVDTLLHRSARRRSRVASAKGAVRGWHALQEAQELPKPIKRSSELGPKRLNTELWKPFTQRFRNTRLSTERPFEQNTQRPDLRDAVVILCKCIKIYRAA